MRSTKILLSLASLAMALALPTIAAAQDCKINADCPRGFACELYDATPPSGGTTCTKEGPCPADQSTSTTTPIVAGSCRPAACKTDSDCGTNMVCHSETYQECSGGSAVAPCPPDTKCDTSPPTESVCTTHAVSACAYRWQLACSADADCGSGFTCLASPKTSCPARAGGSSSGAAGSSGTTTPTSGDSPKSGAATDSSGGGMTPETIPPDSVAECTTTMSFPGYCQPTAVTCAIDSDCPAAWTCQTLPTPGAIDGGGTGAGGNSGSGVTGNGGSSGGAGTPRDEVASPAIDLPLSAEAAKVCLSPFGDTAGRGGTLTGGSADGPATPPTGAKESAVDGDAKTAGSGCAVGGDTGNQASFAVAGLALLALVRAGRRRSRARR